MRHPDDRYRTSDACRTAARELVEGVPERPSRSKVDQYRPAREREPTRAMGLWDSGDPRIAVRRHRPTTIWSNAGREDRITQSDER